MEPRNPSPTPHDREESNTRIRPMRAERSSWFAKTVAQNLAVQDFSIRVTDRRAQLNIPQRTELQRRSDEVVGNIDAIVGDVADLAKRVAPNTRASGLSIDGEQITVPKASSMSGRGSADEHADRFDLDADLQDDAAMSRLENFRRAARTAQKRNVKAPAASAPAAAPQQTSAPVIKVKAKPELALRVAEPVLQDEFDDVLARTQARDPEQAAAPRSELWNAVFDNDDFAKRIKEAREVIARRQQPRS